MRTEELLLNVGPQHPSTHGVFRLVVKIDGEIIKEARPGHRLFAPRYGETGGDLSYTQIIPYTDRMDYLSAYDEQLRDLPRRGDAHGLEIPERAEFLRVIVMELNRIASHCLWLGTYLLDLGAMSSVFVLLAVRRETILDLFNELCGARMTYNYMRVGGVKWDAPDGWIEKVKDFRPRHERKD